jgi:phosphate acetyltransferase
MKIMASIWQRARAQGGLVVLPEAHDERIVRAAGIAAAEGIARPVLIGPEADIVELADRTGADLKKVRVIDPQSSGRLGAYAAALYEARKRKGLTEDEALSLAAEPLYFGSLMVAAGDADGIVAGAATTTADVLRAMIISIGVAEGVSHVSSAFLMVVPSGKGDERFFVFADPSVTPDPDPEQLASIAIASARTWRGLTGLEPYVAMLSFSTKGSATHPHIDKVVEATGKAKAIEPGLKIDGELQADAAIIPGVASKKAPSSEVAGRANVLIFPDLDAANIGYKLVERLAGAKACGPLIQGLAKPASDLSRGCSVEDVVDVIAMTSAQGETARCDAERRNAGPGKGPENASCGGDE